MIRSFTHEIERSLRAHADELRPDLDPAITATVIETVMDAIAHKSVLERSTPLAAETAAHEAYVLIMSYVTRPASAIPSPAGYPSGSAGSA